MECSSFLTIGDLMGTLDQVKHEPLHFTPSSVLLINSDLPYSKGMPNVDREEARINSVNDLLLVNNDQTYIEEVVSVEWLCQFMDVRKVLEEVLVLLWFSLDLIRDDLCR